jgi:hypothetical protein
LAYQAALLGAYANQVDQQLAAERVAAASAQRHGSSFWRWARVAGLAVGAVALTVINGAQAGVDPVTDGLEVADVSADAAAIGDVAAGGDAATDMAAPRGGVYTLRDEAGNVVRTGRTKDLAAREASHANDPALRDYQFNVEYRTDVYAEQRGLEQLLYDRYPGAQAANGGFNKIRGISPTNPNFDFYMQSAWDFLER